jgi:hypothetical protein
MFKSSTNPICFLFSEHSTFWSGPFWSNNDTVCFNSFMIEWIDISFRTVNFLKFKLELSPCFSYTAIFHIGAVNEHSLLRCVTHAWHFYTGTAIAQFKYSSINNMSPQISVGGHIMHKLASPQQFHDLFGWSWREITCINYWFVDQATNPNMRNARWQE